MKCMEDNPNKVLILFDGYEELDLQDPAQDISKIINKSLYPEMKTIVTTNSLAKLRRFGSQAVEGIARINGFNSDQILKYITLFYKRMEDQSKGQKLYDCLLSKTNLLHQARVPKYLELICTSWNKQEYLGDNLDYLFFLLLSITGKL